MEDLREKNFEKVLSSAYDHDTFINFLREFLNDVKLVQPDRYLKVYGTYANSISGYYHIGFFTGRAGKKVALFAIELNKNNSVENARTMQRNFVKSLLESSGCDGALAAFYTADKPQKWRLSLVRLEYEFAKGKIKENLTPAKRYSYLVGEDEPCHTAKERLYPIFAKTDENPTLDELEAAFSVESVTNEFFEAYKEKYLELKEYLESNADFVEESTLHGFTSEQFAKKLMGQIVFLYFIQKKGWLGVDALPVTMNGRDYRNAFYAKGHRSREVVPRLYKQVGEDKYHIDINELRRISDDDEDFLASIVKGKPWGTGPKNFMRLIFEDCMKRGLNYYDDYLEPFFYTGLNRNRGASGYFPPFHRRVPFLSGELFEELDNYDWRNNNFSIPNEMFSNRTEKGVWNGDGILDIFDRYNFTMSEDEPMEREVAIDPEMLGKVFENLLDVKDRKSKGAFYTPREIVHYMCQESLINYLVTRSGIPEADIRKLVVYGEYFKESDIEKTKKVIGADGKAHYELDKQRDLEIPESIFSFKKNVNRIIELDDLLANVKVVDPATGSGAFPLGMLNEIVKTREILTSYMMIEMNGFERLSFYSYGRKPYDLKINTIRNCIFACDIEPSAVDITKLRFYLSLVIDDHISEKASLEFDEHIQPKPLPNLECNIICGNSLVDEFEGRQFITKSDYLKNASNYQMSFAQYSVDPLIKQLINFQDKYFYSQDHDEKENIKQEIQKIYDCVIEQQIKDDPKLMDDYLKAREEAAKPFVLWELSFPKVFAENGGFDIAIGNPPYGLLNKKQNQNTSLMANKYEMKLYKTSDVYGPAKGGVINIFRLFICKSFSLLKNDGHLSLIFPMAFMCDLSSYALRKFVLEKNTINYLEAFPERDDENKRVFRSAKMSVCILGAQRGTSGQTRKFPVRISHDKYVDTRSPIVFMSRQDLETIDEKSLTIPLVDPEEYSILVKLCSGSKRLKEISKCYTGEIDLSLNKKYIRLDNTFVPLLRGAQVQKYYITNRISQGEILYIDDKQYLAENSSDKSKHHLQDRIVMQGITGVNEIYRLKMTLAKAGTYCANSVNYLLVPDDIRHVVLGLLNSKVLNWFFAKLSTNSNVNGYEVDNLPIKLPDDEGIKAAIEKNVRALLNDPSDNSSELRINNDVYKIYGLSSREIEVIENHYRRD